MRLRSLPTRCLLVVASALAACSGRESTPPVVGPPAKLDPLTELSRSAPVGTTVSGGVAVKVSDASGHAVPGVSVAFVVTVGNGTITPRVAVTDANGQATAAWSLGTIAGPNEVTATVSGIAVPLKFEGMGTPGAVASIAILPRIARMLATVDTLRLTAQSLDSFGNVTTPAPVLTVRNPSLISIDTTGLMHALSRGSATYVVATAGSKSDSVLVTVLATGQSLCTGIAAPVQLAIGQVVTDVSGQGVCVHATTANAEYALVPFFNASTPSATTQIEVLPQGVAALGLPSGSFIPAPSPMAVQRPRPLVPDDAFESQLRDRERAGRARLLSGAGPRALRLQRNAITRASIAPQLPAVGDLLKFNVNANDFCDNPDYRTGRVVAITNGAIIVADTANPAGGFTDAEYNSIGVTFDTLVNPVDTAAFGAPTDIDNNGHVILFFTRAVNELTPQGSPNGVVLGFFYQRDLFAKSACPGSNFGEMFYLLVPDTAGVVNGNVRQKAQVVTYTNGTVAHEYQHLINASRRMYVNGDSTNFEEKWLDEGLAHSAEELNFWRASGLSPRSNLDASIYSNSLSKTAIAYSTFAQNNFLRYATYLGSPETHSPIGANALDQSLQLRGAIWNFLRYAADHYVAAGGSENTFWHSLVNSKTTGIANLTNVLGTSPYPMLRDWAISVFMDDNAPNVDPLFQQPSWNARSVLTRGGTSVAFPLLTRILADGVTTTLNLGAYSASFMRFSVPSGQDALLTVTSGGAPLPASIQLAVVRVR